MKNVFLFVLLTLSFEALFGQNYLVNSKVDAFHFTTQLTPTRHSAVLAVTPGFTWDGRLTVGLGIGREVSGDVLHKSRVIRPSVSSLIVKQEGKNNAVSVGINLGYQHNKFEEQDNLVAVTTSIGLAMYHEVATDSGVKLVPGFVFGLSNRRFNRGSRNARSGNTIVYGMLFAAKFNRFYLEPSFLINEDTLVFNLQLGLVFSTMEKS